MLVRRLNFLFAVPVAELSLLCFSFLCFWLVEGHSRRDGPFFDDWIHPIVFFSRVKIYPIISSSLKTKSNNSNISYCRPEAMEFSMFD
jgi:hypothetical protein